jgi:hypothetical protein
LPPPEIRRVVLDEDICWKLMGELQRRGRADATAVMPLGLDGLKDGQLFKALAQDFEPCVLVTWDNKMPVAHAAEIAHHGTTVAVVDERWFKRSGRPLDEREQYIRDIVHRWLHRIEVQSAGELRIYSPIRPRKAPAIAKVAPVV